MRETSRAYDTPFRPWPLRAAHALLRGVGLDDRPRLTVGALVEAARRAEGLQDLGEPGLEPLERLLESIEQEAALTPMGRLATRIRLVQSLRSRLRAVELRKRHPEIASGQITAPIVITGLQRTGTTLLHRLLAADPRLRSLRSWEALSPAPPLRGPDRRRAVARQAEAGLRWMSPDFFAVHPVEADAPEEEVLLLDQSFLSTVPEATLRVPRFSAWLEGQDQRPAYQMLHDQLQLLQWQSGPHRWVLKTPHHLEWLDTLLAVFPDATVVMTHRDPVVTVGSFCSMVAHGRGVMSDRVDPKEIGRDWLAKVGRMMDRALATRADRNDRGFVDVDYGALMADPLGTVARIQSAAGLPRSQAAHQAMANAMAAMPKDRHGTHRYELADFGLSPGGVEARFASYRARFLS